MSVSVDYQQAIKIDFIYLKVTSIDAQCDIAEALIFEQETQIVGKPTFRNFKLDCVGLARNIDAVSNDAHL